MQLIVQLLQNQFGNWRSLVSYNKKTEEQIKGKESNLDEILIALNSILFKIV